MWKKRLPVDGFNLKVSHSVMIIATKDKSLKLMLVILIVYRKYTVIFHFCLQIDECGKKFCNIFGKKKYVLYIKALKQALDYGLILKKSIG